MYYESENFSDSSLQHIFEYKNFRFPFLFDENPKLGNEMWKYGFRKSLGIY